MYVTLSTGFSYGERDESGEYSDCCHYGYHLQQVNGVKAYGIYRYGHLGGIASEFDKFAPLLSENEYRS